MDKEGLWQRRSKAIPVKTLYGWIQNTTDKPVIPAWMAGLQSPGCESRDWHRA